MIESTERPDTGWWALIRRTLTGHWWQLLVMQALFAAGYLAEEQLRVLLARTGCYAAGAVWGVVASGLLLAWNWSAALRILDAGHGPVTALVPDVRRTGRLGAWLVVLGITDLLRLLIYISPGAYTAFVFSPANGVTQLLAVYLSFATALLPMAILLEGQGLRRGWKLTHRDWPTALRTLLAVAIGGTAAIAVQQLQLHAWGRFPEPPDAFPYRAAAVLIGNLERVLAPVLLYTAYHLSPGARGEGGEVGQETVTSS